MKQYLKDSLFSQSTATTLAHVASLERKVAKHFQVKDFLSLEQGNFLEFLVKHMQVHVSVVRLCGSTVFCPQGYDANVPCMLQCAAAAGHSGLCFASVQWQHGTGRQWYQTHQTRRV